MVIGGQQVTETITIGEDTNWTDLGEPAKSQGYYPTAVAIENEVFMKGKVVISLQVN